MPDQPTPSPSDRPVPADSLLFEATDTQFCEVALPLPLPGTFTYRVPREWTGQVPVGGRVIVQFGKRKVMTGLVTEVHHRPPARYQAKYLLEMLDDEAVVGTAQLALLRWMADYYVCALGEVVNAALPAGLKISSQSRLQLHPEFDLLRAEGFSAQEVRLLQALSEKDSLSYEEAADLLEVKQIYQQLKTLTERRAVILFEEVKEKYRPKRIRRVRLAEAFLADEALADLCAQLEGAPRQLEVLLYYLREVPVAKDAARNEAGVARSAIAAAGLSAGALGTLLKREIFEEFEETVSRFPLSPTPVGAPVSLSAAQQRARDQIMALFETRSTVLFHGITGSGKTQVYTDLIQRVLASGAQVLLMLPEIAITTQIVERLRRVFGTRMGVYHSRFSDNERVEVWRGIVDGTYAFVVGVRSSVFLPFDNLGLVIVDEEHEGSYKQFDPAPRYHARDVAIMLGQLHGARVLLGSATPSLEAYHLARTDRWGLVELMQRFGEAQLPDMRLANTRQEREAKTLRQGFTTTLLQALQHCLDQGEQAILFQNRRGYAPYVACADCEWIPRCHQCDVSLTYHQHAEELRCHYCGYQEKVKPACPDCGSTQIRHVGYGTEKLEELLQLLLPQAKVGRMDLDTTRAKTGYDQLIRAFETHEIDILVGTQMISKGLDFEKVSLVGVFDADRMLNYPDFRANERAFQMITQVSGRAGRRDKRGVVIVQTSNPERPILDLICRGDYAGLYESEIRERELFYYPPFTRLIRLTTKAPERTLAQRTAELLARICREHLGEDRVLGPEAPLVERIRNQFHQDILLKLEREKIDFRAVKQMLRDEIAHLRTDKQYKFVRFVIDVDPA